jgi:hypothetical protein
LSHVKYSCIAGDTVSAEQLHESGQTVLTETNMNFFKSLALITAISVTSSIGNAVAAEQKASDAQHKAHHPAATKPVSKDNKKLRDIDEQMKSMQNSMHMMDMMKQDSDAMPMSGQAHEMMMQAMMDRQSAQDRAPAK